MVGTLPASLSNLQQLGSILLGNNYIMGQIPVSYTTLRLTALDLADNLLNGTLSAALAPLFSTASVSLVNNYLDASVIPPALCAFACNTDAADTAFNCPSARVATQCPACAAAPPVCQSGCAYAGVNASSWTSSVVAACSSALPNDVCLTCLPALEAPALALGADDRTAGPCVGQFLPVLLGLGVSVTYLDLISQCHHPGGPGGGAPSCAVTLMAPEASFAAAGTTCASSLSGRCGTCLDAAMAPFLRAGVASPAELIDCIGMYARQMSDAGLPLTQLSFCNIDGLPYSTAARTPGPGKRSNAAVLGGAIGGSLGGAALVCVVALLVARRARRRRTSETHSAASSGNSSGWRAVVSDEAEVKLGKLLGQGGFAAVYEARWRGTLVAVKVFESRGLGTFQRMDQSVTGLISYASQDTHTGSDSVLQPHGSGAQDTTADPSFAREVVLLSKLRHPNILAIYAFVPGPRSMLVMELGSLGSLKALLERSSLASLPWAERVKLGAGVACGVAFLHAQTPPIIHRDLKSANIVLDRSRTPKVADLGVSGLDLGVKAKVKRGTLRYMAPEVAQELVIEDFKAIDAYGVGMILLDLAHINTDAGAAARLAAAAAPSATATTSSGGASSSLKLQGGSTSSGLAPDLQVLLQRAATGFVTAVDAHVPEPFAAVVRACAAVQPSARPTAQEAQQLLEAAALAIA